jgi:hypothetical protein
MMNCHAVGPLRKLSFLFTCGSCLIRFHKCQHRAHPGERTCVYSDDHRPSVCYRTHFSTLPRKPLAREGPLCPSKLSRTASLHTRSQSLIDVGRGGGGEDVRRASLNALIEQRRRGISKLRGLIIPEKLSEVVTPSHTICDLPEIRSKDSILSTSKAPPATSLQRYVRLW